MRNPDMESEREGFTERPLITSEDKHIIKTDGNVNVES